METFNVKILQMRKRIGIKEISAPSMDIAERSIFNLLKQHLGFKAVSEKVTYLNRTPSERKLNLHISNYSFSISLIKIH